MKPVLPLPLLVPLLLGAIVFGCWLAWRGTSDVGGRTRLMITSLRGLALVVLGVFLLDPGRWEAQEEDDERVWALLVDESESMQVTEDGRTRAARADEAVREAREVMDARGLKVEEYRFAGNLLDADGGGAGGGTRLVDASRDVFSRAGAQGKTLAGMVIVSDGRQTERGEPDAVWLRAQAAGAPIHAVVVGGAYNPPDLKLTSPRPSISAFPGQPVSLAGVVENTGMGPLRVDVRLVDGEGTELATGTSEIEEGGRGVVILSAEAPAESGTWRLVTAVQDGETRDYNNSADVRVRVVNSKTRVFLVEGAPYWDSKFLAQMLRQQEFIEISSVYQLSEDRFFRIESDSARPAESSEALFPATREELGSYDLVVFGKNVEPFLTPEREEALVSYVRDGGGAVLFSRGKAYSRTMPGLETLEPVVWATGTASEFRLLPSEDGMASGLFGQALPGREAAVWQDLPLLKDAYRIDRVKPFTRVLADGKLASTTGRGTFPLVLVRRYGQGVSGLVNADGLWKWDFYPEARELGNMYLEFWTQLIHWMASYSEFLPGQDYSLKLSTLRVMPGEVVGCEVSFRGSGDGPMPQLLVESDGLDEALVVVPGEIPAEGGRPRWRGSFTPREPGTYRVLVQDPTQHLTAVPELVVTVSAPPAESDNLNADPDFLREFAEATGGRSHGVEGVRGFFEEILQIRLPEQQERGAAWKSWWKRWELAVILVCVLAMEWWLRRRNGLI